MPEGFTGIEKVPLVRWNTHWVEGVLTKVKFSDLGNGRFVPTSSDHTSDGLAICIRDTVKQVLEDRSEDL